ncbi:Phosphorylated adapter RNA export protein [Liparis tanakae]|uniref:Phosphorylated adapter RNA export protein n=1 Tax=Liparis tanakae TaxID=230148 RepID=A0A4Z2F1W4_9TELE|nr:Phosphorylated adapter RNA export protein [Liparis tanakae]
MEGDLEDGELSGSDTEMGPAPPQVPPASSGQSFHDRAAAQRSAAAYRSGGGGAAASSDSDVDSSDEEATLWRRKRHKASPRPAAPRPAARPEPSRLPAPDAPGGRKVNNIWGSVVQEQCQDAVAAELGFFGMEGGVSMSSRNVETYNFVLARKIMEKERELDRQANDDGEVSMLDAQLEEYMKERDCEDRDAKRKRPAKERLGPRAEMDTKGRYEITEDDPEATVTEEIAHRLREPKKDLIERIVAVIGNKKAIELLGETATLEEAGGVHTMDGSRRRTPGGVYINLLKNTPSISKAQVRKIFLEEHQRECKSKKAAQKRRRHAVAKKMKQAIGTLNLQEHDDVSRETFASDTNDALESLEEAADDEEEGREEAAAGIEDTASVVYNAADLEVF